MSVVQCVLDVHAEVFERAAQILVGAGPASLWEVPFVPVPAKPKFDGTTAREGTIVDADLDMTGAMHAALQLSFPAERKRIDAVLQAVVCELACVRDGAVSHRRAARAAVREAVRVLAPATADLRNLVPVFLRPIVGHVDFGLFETIVRVIGWPHADLIDYCIFGFPPVGRIPACGCHRPIEPEPEPVVNTRADNAQTFDKAVEILTRRARRESASASGVADQLEIWRVTLSECDKGFCVGPLTRRAVEDMFAHVRDGPSCIPAFGIWQKGKLRRIDDAAVSGANDRTQMLETIVCDAADLPADIAAEFASYWDVCDSDFVLGIGTDDIGSAYRVCIPSRNPEHTIAAVWKPAAAGGAEGVYYFVLRGFNFGLKSAPLHLGSVLSPLVDFARRFFLIACGRFYDDVVAVDAAKGGASAQLCLSFLFQKIGFPFAPKKHERMRRANPFLGMVTDFSYIALGYVLIRVKEQRRRKLVAEIQEVLRIKRLTPAHAARLRGKLYFTTCSAFYGIGRPALQALTKRQYDKGKTSKLTPELESCLRFFIALLARLPPRRVRLKPDERGLLYVWSDAMYEALRNDAGGYASALDPDTGEVVYLGRATIAFVVFDAESGEWHVGSRDIGLEEIRLMVPGKKTYIGQLEALAADAVLHTLPPDVLHGRSAMFWIDNLSAKYGLQRAYSKVADTGRIINAFKVKQAALEIRVWFEYVPSEQNVADLPSRGAWERFYEVVDSVCPAGWRCTEYAFVKFSDFSSWESPLRELPLARKRARHGSRGAKRRKA